MSHLYDIPSVIGRLMNMLYTLAWKTVCLHWVNTPLKIKYQILHPTTRFLMSYPYACLANCPRYRYMASFCEGWITYPHMTAISTYSNIFPKWKTFIQIPWRVLHKNPNDTNPFSGWRYVTKEKESMFWHSIRNATIKNYGLVSVVDVKSIDVFYDR